MEAMRIAATAKAAMPRLACIAGWLLACTPLAHAQSTNTDDLPPAFPIYETLRYRVAYDGGENSWAYEVRLYTDRSVLYLGSGKVKNRGRRTLRISPEQYDSLLRAFEYADFLHMRNPVSGGRDTSMRITHTLEGVSNTLTAGDPGPRWPQSLFQLAWSVENTLQAQKFACPILFETNKNPVDACADRAKLMDALSPRRRTPPK
jgi:hypothetical protein